MTRTHIVLTRIAALAFCIGFWAFIATHAHAEDAKQPAPPAPPATVTLTADELQKLVSAEVAKALAGHDAEAVYKKVNEALAPKKDAVK